MSQLKKYQILIKDTLNFLEIYDKNFVESKNDFFNKYLETKSKKVLSEIDISKKMEKPKISSPPIIAKESSEKTIEPQIKQETTPLINKSAKEEKQTKIIEKEKPPIAVEEKKKTLAAPKETLNKPSFQIAKTKKISLEEKPPIIEDNFSDIKQSFPKVFPNIKIVETILDDKIAKQKAQKYKLKNIAAGITILAYRENEKHYRFLEKLSIALNIYFYPSKVVSAYLMEKENNWDLFLSENDIFLIISSDYTIFELSNLRKYFRENPAKQEKYLKDIPLFLLPDISIYLKEPTLKSSLFKALKQKITNLKE